MKVGQLLVAAFGLSRNGEPELNGRWIRMSFRIGSQLPQSLLSVSIQRLGEVDLVCRALEKELLEQPPRDGQMDLRPNYLAVLSEWWIGSAYAICYTLMGRKILWTDEFLKLADDLRMIRVQIEKYEVPSDKKLTEPLQFSPTQLRPDEKEAPIYVSTRQTGSGHISPGRVFPLVGRICGKCLTSKPMRLGGLNG